MKPVLKYVVVPFRFASGRYTQAEMREASTEDRAVALAAALAPRYAGVIAFEVYVYLETGEITAPRELVRFGEMPVTFLEDLAA